MLTHIVSININSSYSKSEKENAIFEITSALKTLPINIEQIKYYEVGVNTRKVSGSMDIVLISKFNNEKDLEIYRTHKEHLNALNIITKHKESSFFTDYFIPEFIIK